MFGLAAEVAFFLLLSFPPALLAILGSMGWIADLLGPDVSERIRTQVLEVGSLFLTEETNQEILQPAVDSILEEGRGAVVSVGVILTVWSASRATNRTMEAVNIAYDVEEMRTGWKRRLLAFGVTIGAMLAVVIVLPVLVAGPGLMAAMAKPLGLGEAIVTTWRFLYWPTVGALRLALLATFFHVSTPWRTPWRRDLPGAVLAAVLWLVGGAALRIYATRFIEGGVFGPLAAPIVFLLWLYVIAIAVLAGAELNGEIEKTWPTSETIRGRREAAAEREEAAREEEPEAQVPRGM